MGRFSYGATITVDFEDRVLIHLHTVIAAKIRRGESCMFTWVDDDCVGGGRTTVWLTPTSALAFRFLAKRPPEINRSWVEALMQSANSVAGLHVVPEPDDVGLTSAPRAD